MENQPNSTSSINKLAQDVEIEGTLTFNGTLEFDGKLTGDVESEGTLIVGKNGQIRGNIRTQTATIFGATDGNITTNKRCTLKSTCKVHGDIKTHLFSMDEGAAFTGSLSMGNEKL